MHDLNNGLTFTVYLKLAPTINLQFSRQQSLIIAVDVQVFPSSADLATQVRSG